MSDKDSKFCSYCGTSVKLDDVFCNNCGASLDETIESVSTPIQQQPYTQTTYSQQATAYTPQPSTLDGVAIVALIFGIISVAIQFIPFVSYISLICSIIAIITGAISMTRTQKKYLSIIGIVLGVIGIALYFIAIFVGFRLYMLWW